MSAISKEEFEAALTKAHEASVIVPIGQCTEMAIRAFFAALPQDVKLLRKSASDEMLGKSCGYTDFMLPAEIGETPEDYKQEMATAFSVMFDAAPQSLPE